MRTHVEFVASQIHSRTIHCNLPEAPAMEALCCPLCSTPLEASGLEAHLRYELRYPLAACYLCPVTFCDAADADKHFTGTFAKHPDVQPQLIQPPSDAAKEARLEELARLARGGEEAVQQRLCVCGQCRLLCREDFRSGQPARTPNFRVKGSPDSPRSNQFREADRDQRYRGDDSPDPAFHFASDIGPLKPSQFLAPGPDSPQALADESEPNDLSDRDEDANREDREQYDREFYDQHDSQQSDAEAASAVDQKKAPRGFSTERKSNPNLKTSSLSIGKKPVRKPPQTKKSAAAAKELRCGSCDRAVRSWDVKEHTSRFHLRQALHECKVCGYSLCHTNVGQLNTHIRKAHGQAPGPGTVDSGGLRRHEHALKAMIQRLFRM